MLDECEALSVFLVYFIRAGMVKQCVQDGGMTTLQHGADVLASMFNAKQ